MSTIKAALTTVQTTFVVVVCNAIGLETATASADYIGSYEGNTKLLSNSLEYVRATANRILTATVPENSAV
jgi:hypothetical protein